MGKGDGYTGIDMPTVVSSLPGNDLNGIDMDSMKTGENVRRVARRQQPERCPDSSINGGKKNVKEKQKNKQPVIDADD